MLVPHHSVFTGQMPFLPPNQQRQSTEGTLPLAVLQKCVTEDAICKSIPENPLVAEVLPRSPPWELLLIPRT